MKRRVREWVKDAVHNCLVHPLLPFLPTSIGDQLHDASARWPYGPPVG